jgi:hypothetical protein
MKKKAFLKKLSQIVELRYESIENVDLNNVDSFDSLKQLELITFYEKVIKDEKIILKISNLKKINKIMNILIKSNFIK